MKVSEKDLIRLIIQVTQQINNAQNRLKEPVYIIFSTSFQDPGDKFWQEISRCKQSIAIIPDFWTSVYSNKLQERCSSLLVVPQKESGELSLDGSLTIYPSVSHTFAAKAALCISDTFETQWLKKCMDMGTSVCFLLSGLEKFTGNESGFYKKQIMHYYKTLLMYGIDICSADNLFEQGELKEKNEKKVIFLQERIITSYDIYAMEAGSITHILPKTIVTAAAYEAAEQKRIQIIRTGR